MTTPPLTIEPLSAPAVGTWVVPGSKSITNRALLLAALSDRACRLTGVLHSDDTRHMTNALRSLGTHIDNVDATTVEVTPKPWSASKEPLFVGNSGTTVRFMAAASTLVNGSTILAGDEHMAKRPITPLVTALTELGIDVHCETGCPPLRITSQGSFSGGSVSLPGTISSQYLSALAMVATRGQKEMSITPTGGLVSRPYVTMTSTMINDFGGQAELTDADVICVKPQLPGRSGYHVEPDASTASYPLAIAAATGGTLQVPGLHRSALQGDVAFADILERMGATITWDADAITVSGPQQLRGVDVDMHHISDTVMTLAALAPLAEGPTTIRNVANIRVKETDRLHALVTELTRLGQQVDHGDDWLRIHPRPVSPATIECYADHRIAMSFAVLGLMVPGVTIADPDCVAKTYPNFWADLDRFRAEQATS